MGHWFNISTCIRISLQRGPQPRVDGVSSTVSSPLSTCLHEGRCQFWLTLLGCRLDAFPKYLRFDTGNSVISQEEARYFGFCSELNGDPVKRLCTHPNPWDLGVPKMPKGVMKWRILTRGAYPGRSGWAKSNHKHPRTREAGGLGHTERRRPRDQGSTTGRPTPADTRSWEGKEQILLWSLRRASDPGSNFRCPESRETLSLSFLANHPICWNLLRRP